MTHATQGPHRNVWTTAGAGGHSAAMATPTVVPTTALIECLLWLQTAAHSVLGGAESASARMDGGPAPSLASAADLTQTSTRTSLARDRAPWEKSPTVRSAIRDQRSAKWHTHAHTTTRPPRGLRATHPLRTGSWRHRATAQGGTGQRAPTAQRRELMPPGGRARMELEQLEHV